MKVIALEEHYRLAAVQDANADHPFTALMDKQLVGGGKGANPQGDWPPGVSDIDEGRIAAMDAAGIDIQILSHSAPGTETIEPSLAVDLAKLANDAVSAAVRKHPDRFRGFAALPMRDPTAAAAELERTVRESGFVGAMINGHVDGRYLDDKFFWPVFESAEALGVPIYVHPTLPPLPVVDAYYSGFSPYVSARLSAAGVGWHIDTAIHCLRLIFGGVFDRFPDLQIIVGHHFEALTWMAWRTEYAFPVKVTGLKRTIKEYFQNNFYGGILAGEFAHQHPRAVDPSWSLSFSAYQSMLNLIGIDRIVFTTDYPYGNITAGRQFLEQMPISTTDKAKIAHLNAERLLKL